MTERAKLVPLMVPSENKGHYIHSSRKRGMRLQDWADRAMTAQYDFDQFTLGIPELKEFEAYVCAMPREKARELHFLLMQADGQHDDAVVDLKMVKGYLQKRLILGERGGQEADLHREIAADMLHYHAAYPQTSESLMRALLEVIDGQHEE